MFDCSLVIDKKEKCMLMNPVCIKDIIGWDTSTVSCGSKQVNAIFEKAMRCDDDNKYKVSHIIDNCCYIFNNYTHEQYFFYTKDTVTNDVIFVKADMDEKRGRIAAVKEAV